MRTSPRRYVTDGVRGITSRRVFATAIAVSLIVALASEVQAQPKRHRVALILSTSPIAEMAGSQPVHPGTRVFLEELRGLGYAEGRNLIVERRTAEGKFERFPSIVRELVAAKAEVIVIGGNNTNYMQAKETTSLVPIVMIASSEPQKYGLVASLARPGGNVTGLTIESSPQIEAKRLEMLKQAIPGLRRVAYLATRSIWESEYGNVARGAAQSLSLELLHMEHTPSDYTVAFAGIARERPDAIFPSFSAETFAQREVIVDFARKANLPGIFPYREMAEAGGLMSYGMSVPDLFRRAAHYVDKILKGADPALLPIEQPTKYDMVVNLRTAKALKLEIPAAVLLQADRIIE